MTKRSSLAAALLGAVALSFSAIFFALSEVGPATGAFFRGLYALPVLFFLYRRSGAEDHRSPRERYLAFGAGIALGIDIVAWHASIEHIGTGLATLLANSQVLIVALAAWLIFGERPERRVVISIPIVLVGVAMVSGLGRADAFGGRPVLGTVLALVAAAFYSWFLLGLRRSNRSRAPVAGPLFEATAGATLAALLGGLALFEIDFTPGLESQGWLIGLALSAQVVGWLLVTYALPRLPAAETATIILSQPVLTMMWGAMIFDERPSATQLAGAVVVLAGVALVAVQPKQVTLAPKSR